MAALFRFLAPSLRWRGGKLSRKPLKTNHRAGKWILRYQLNSVRRDMGLGSYPAVSLAEARIAAADAEEQDETRGGKIGTEKFALLFQAKKT